MQRARRDRSRAHRSAHRAPGVVLVGVLVLSLVALVVLAVSDVRPAAAQPTTTEVTDAERELAERYAPVMMLVAHPEECSDDGEPFGPMAVDVVLGNPQIALRQLGNGDPVVMWGPTARDLHGLRGGFYLDFPGRALTPGCVYERDYRAYASGRRATVYAHVVTQPDEPGLLALQYWFYWYFNDWNDKHESDWEGIQLVFEATSAEEALRVEPKSVGYAQHEGGERADWDDGKLERIGTHPVVYSSAGSHASYFGSALFLGRSAREGFGCDNTDGPSVRVDPEVVVLPDTVDDPEHPLAWLAFRGRWGEHHGGVFDAPDGPASKARWTEPITWHDGLRDSSVVVPTGDAQAAAIVDTFCSLVVLGSNQVVAFTRSPVRGITAAIVVGVLALLLVRRTTWTATPPLPVVASRSAGQVVRASGRVLRLAPASLALLGLAAVAFGLLGGVLSALAHRAPIVEDVLAHAEANRPTRFFVTLFVGSLTSVVTWVLLTAAVSWTLRELDDGRTPSPLDAIAAVGRRIGPLASAFVRALVIVGTLFVTVVGIPFGIRRLVRYGFLPQVVMLECCGGADALRRSRALVVGRWWRTAVMLGAIHLVVTTGAAAVSVVLLVVVEPPFWLLTVVFVAVAALVHVVGAITATLLYGDAAHTRPDLDRADRGSLREAQRTTARTTGR